MARKARPADDETNNPQPPPKSNVTDDTIRKHVVACGEKKTALESAQGEYRASLKAAKSDGVSQSAIAWYLRARKLNVEDIDRETRERTRIAKIMLLPIGTQLGFFDDGQGVADGIGPIDAHAEGRQAHRNNNERTSNPYPPESKKWHDWDAGWFGEQKKVAERARGMFSDHTDADAHA
jgi:hypothetical protein